MAITSNGIGSGLDINGLVNQLMSIEARPVTQLNTKEASFQAKLSAFGQLKSMLTPFQSAVSGLKDISRFQTMRATLGDSSLAMLTATSDAVKDSYSFEVMQLAQSQRVVTSETAEPTVGAGTLTISFGTYVTDDSDPDNPVTTLSSTRIETVTLDASQDSLSDLRDAINEADIGIRAQIVNNGSVDQLIFAGSGVGAGQAFKISGSGDLAGFGFDLSTGGTNTMTSLETAQDAKIKLDGVTLTRSTNSISDAIDGVTMNLLKASPGTTTTLSVSNDRSAVKTSIEALVKAYNDFNTGIRGLTAVDTEAKSVGVLTGDATARSIQSQMRNAFGTLISSFGGVSSLSEIGITFNRDGSLSLNSVKLEGALNDPDKKVAEFFAGTDGAKGFATLLNERIGDYLKAGGVLDSRTEGINDSIKSLDRQRETLARRLETIEKRYRAQFTALDALVGSMTQTSNYLQQQLANLPQIQKSS